MALYLWHRLMDLHSTFVINVSLGEDELIMFGGHRVEGQGSVR